jgi:hypothetical protein
MEEKGRNRLHHVSALLDTVNQTIGMLPLKWATTTAEMMADNVRALIEAEALDVIITEHMKWVDTDSGCTVMHLIARLGSVDLLEHALKTPLITHVDKVDFGNRSPLYYAVHCGDLKKARLLLKAGAHMPCYGEQAGVSYSRIRCPFELTLGNENLDMAILLLTAQGRFFPDGHDQNCCRSGLTKPGPAHLARCRQEMDKRSSRARGAFYPFLFHLKRATSGANHIIYREVLIPMLRAIWRETRYDPCWVVGEKK